MVQSTATEIGTILGKSISQAQNYKEDFFETEETSDISLVNVESANLRSSYFVYQQDIGVAFVLDHPVNGYLDSSIYELDTGLGARTLFSSGDIQL